MGLYLANPQFEFTSVQQSNPLAKFLDTESRQLSLGMNSTQATKLRELVGLEGRGMGDVAKQSKDFFKGKALTTPNSPEGMELSSLMNGMGDDGKHLLQMGREGGPAGESAFSKLTSGNPEMARVDSYTIAEMEAIGGRGSQIEAHINTARNALAPEAHSSFNELVVNSKKPLSDTLNKLDSQIATLQKKLTGAKSKASGKIQSQIDQLTAIKKAAEGIRDAQQLALQPRLTAGEQAFSQARGLISKDFRIGKLNMPEVAAEEAVAQRGTGALGTMATVGGIGGLAGLLAGRGSGGSATKAREEMMARASFGLSPLHAPVAYMKKTASALDAPVAKPKFKPHQNFKPISPDKVPAQSTTTATAGALEQSMKYSSALTAPVRGNYHGHV